MERHSTLMDWKTILRWQYSPNCSKDSKQSLSKSQVPPLFCSNLEDDSKTHMEMNETQNSQKVLEKMNKVGRLTPLNFIYLFKKK